jgi:NAD(P)-dependent dehydrogenase (short-subunit alcohol dehydrogenase family)
MMNGDLSGKVVLIIGASRGIGAATARAFAREGAKLILASRDVAAMDQLVAAFPLGTEARIIRTDLTVPSEIIAAVALATQQFGRLDIAFNNGGISQQRAPLADVSDEVFDKAMNTNVRGFFIAMKHEIRAMLNTGGGSIVNTGSITSTVVIPNMGAYVSSKHALAGLTKSAAIDYAAQNIRVNMVAPGPVDTLMTQQGALATEEGRRLIANLTPMRRIAAPEEIAEVVLWLASAKAGYVTGAILPADGGYTLP